MSLKSGKTVKKAALWGGSALLAVIFVSSILYSARNPEPERSQENFESFESYLRNPGKVPAEEREKIQEQWGNLSPETKEKITVTFIRHEMESFREKISKLPQKERLEKIREKVINMQKNRPDKDKQVTEIIQGMDIKRITRDSLIIYQSELSAMERAELAPLAHELIRQANTLLR